MATEVAGPGVRDGTQRSRATYLVVVQVLDAATHRCSCRRPAENPVGVCRDVRDEVSEILRERLTLPAAAAPAGAAAHPVASDTSRSPN